MATSMTTYAGRFNTTNMKNKQTSFNDNKQKIAADIRGEMLSLGISISRDGDIIEISDGLNNRNNKLRFNINNMDLIDNKSFEIFCEKNQRGKLNGIIDILRNKYSIFNSDNLKSVNVRSQNRALAKLVGAYIAHTDKEDKPKYFEVKENINSNKGTILSLSNATQDNTQDLIHVAQSTNRLYQDKQNVIATQSLSQHVRAEAEHQPNEAPLAGNPAVQPQMSANTNESKPVGRVNLQVEQHSSTEANKCNASSQQPKLQILQSNQPQLQRKQLVVQSLAQLNTDAESKPPEHLLEPQAVSLSQLTTNPISAPPPQPTNRINEPIAKSLQPTNSFLWLKDSRGNPMGFDRNDCDSIRLDANGKFIEFNIDYLIQHAEMSNVEILYLIKNNKDSYPNHGQYLSQFNYINLIIKQSVFKKLDDLNNTTQTFVRFKEMFNTYLEQDINTYLGQNIMLNGFQTIFSNMIDWLGRKLASDMDDTSNKFNINNYEVQAFVLNLVQRDSLKNNTEAYYCVRALIQKIFLHFAGPETVRYILANSDLYVCLSREVVSLKIQITNNYTSIAALRGFVNHNYVGFQDIQIPAGWAQPVMPIMQIQRREIAFEVHKSAKGKLKPISKLMNILFAAIPPAHQYKMRGDVIKYLNENVDKITSSLDKNSKDKINRVINFIKTDITAFNDDVITFLGNVLYLLNRTEQGFTEVFESKEDRLNHYLTYFLVDSALAYDSASSTSCMTGIKERIYMGVTDLFSATSLLINTPYAELKQNITDSLRNIKDNIVQILKEQNTATKLINSDNLEQAVMQAFDTYLTHYIHTIRAAGTNLTTNEIYIIRAHHIEEEQLLKEFVRESIRSQSLDYILVDPNSLLSKTVLEYIKEKLSAENYTCEFD